MICADQISWFIKFAERGFRVLLDTYVTATSGTGIVHQAPAFGDDDHRIAIKAGIVKKDEMPPCPIDERGMFTAEVPEYQGQYIKVRVERLFPLTQMLTSRDHNRRTPIRISVNS